MFYSNVERNEILYQEVDIQASQYAIIQSYANLTRTMSQALYSEAEDEGKGKSPRGLLPKIIHFFKNLTNKVIAFIKKIINFTVMLLCKPFGAKMVMTPKDGGKSEGASNGSAEGTGSTPPSAVKSGNMEEVVRILRNVSSSLNSTTISAVSYESIVNKTNPFVISNKDKYAELGDNPSSSTLGTSLKVAKELTGEIESMLSEFKSYNTKIHNADDIVNPNSSEDLLSAAINKITGDEKTQIVNLAKPDANGDSLIPKNHKSISASFSVIDKAKIDNFKKHVASLTAMVSLITIAVGTASGLGEALDDEFNKSTNSLDYDRVLGSIWIGVDNLMSGIKRDDKGISKLGLSDDAEYNAFGVPAKMLAMCTPFFVIRALPDAHFNNTFKGKEVDLLVKQYPELKDYTGPKYREVLTNNKPYNFNNITSAFKPITISGSGDLKKFIEDIDKSITDTGLTKSVNALVATLNEFKDMDRVYNTKDENGKTLTDRDSEKLKNVEDRLSDTGASATTLREILGVSATVVRHMGGSISECTSNIREIVFEVEAASKAVAIVSMANVIMYKRDYIHYAAHTATSLLNDKKYIADNKINEAEVTKLRETVKEVLSNLTKLSLTYKF